MPKKPQTAPPIVKRSARGTLHRENGMFVKGNVRAPNTGRAKGTRNRTTTLLKDAILTAATLVGENGKGKDGLVGYLKMLAVKEKVVYARLLEKVLPLQIAVEDRTKPQYTVAEAAQKLRERGLPVPSLMLVGPDAEAMAIADQLQDRQDADGQVIEHDDDYDDELSGDEG